MPGTVPPYLSDGSDGLLLAFPIDSELLEGRDPALLILSSAGPITVPGTKQGLRKCWLKDSMLSCPHKLNKTAG